MSSSDHRVLSKLLTTATHCEHILLDKLRNCIAASYNLALFTKDGVFERIVTETECKDDHLLRVVLFLVPNASTVQLVLCLSGMRYDSLKDC